MAICDGSCVRVRCEMYRASLFNRSKRVFQCARNAYLGTRFPLRFKQFPGQLNLQFYYSPQFLICVSLGADFHRPVKQLEVLLSWRTKLTDCINLSQFVHVKQVNLHFGTAQELLDWRSWCEVAGGGESYSVVTLR